MSGIVDGTRPGSRPRIRWRLWLRAIHRDVGYFSVGLTFIYAASGLAVNHIADWEPNFREVERVHQVAVPLPAEDERVADTVRETLGIAEPLREVFRADERDLEVVFDRRTLRVDTQTGRVVEHAQEPRFFLRVANWLHLNRGKRAWTIIADSYAVFLLLLSLTGLWMFPGRKGLLGRAGVMALAGALVPALYVTLSGGP
ncbi:MAG TPA: PepSY-associated TM helix domain-containing protein [Polyangiaceae bacterium]|nr:PepSY-associated TM helix domain-containing protein [Polyangiaceae bacterium]